MGTLGTAVVLDSGTFNIKAGFSHEHFPSIISRTSNSNESPIQYGVIKDWNAMELIWQNTFKQLDVNYAEHPILIAESSMNSNESREYITELMMETFGFPAIYISNEACLSLHYSGRTAGLSVHFGHEAIHAVPIYQSYVLHSSALCSKYGGVDVTNKLMQLLSQGGFNFKTSEDAEAIRLLKEKLCYIAFDTVSESSNPPEDLKRTHKLPDGKFITVDTDRYLAGEGIFSPSLFGKAEISIQDLIKKSISMCDASMHKYLYKNIVISGGTALLPGLSRRLQKEIKHVSPTTEKICVCIPETPQYSSWIGGATLSSIPSFQNLWLTRKEYEECGSQIIHKKCY